MINIFNSGQLKVELKMIRTNSKASTLQVFCYDSPSKLTQGQLERLSKGNGHET